MAWFYDGYLYEQICDFRDCKTLKCENGKTVPTKLNKVEEGLSYTTNDFFCYKYIVQYS